MSKFVTKRLHRHLAVRPGAVENNALESQQNLTF